MPEGRLPLIAALVSGTAAVAMACLALVVVGTGF